MTFGTNYDKKKAPAEKYRKPSVVKAEGYVTPEALVKGMVIAGQHFASNKQALYDTEEGTSLSVDVPIDPTRDLGYSELDALDDMRTVQGRLRAAKEEYDRKVKETIVEASKNPNSDIGTPVANVPAVAKKEEA